MHSNETNLLEAQVHRGAARRQPRSKVTVEPFERGYGHLRQRAAPRPVVVETMLRADRSQITGVLHEYSDRSMACGKTSSTSCST